MCRSSCPGRRTSRGEGFESTNNVFLGTDDGFVVWQIELVSRDDSSVKVYRVEASVPGCCIEDIWDVTQSGEGSGQEANPNCALPSMVIAAFRFGEKLCLLFPS